MRLVIREYLASLKERGELDAVLPDLLTELGFTVFSRPARGTRQFGVDVAAVGPGDDGVRRVHLFSIKAGDLTRTEWNGPSEQSMRPSLDEIRDVYIRNRIPSKYKDLPIAICLCFGGDVEEQVRDQVTGYTDSNTTDRITFEEWNGDRLADVILNGILREELLPEPLRGYLRKAAAMVDEPEVAIRHFEALLRALVDDAGKSAKARLSQARLVNICLWILFVWARDANNVEAPYRASERSLLEIWHLLRGDLAGTGIAADRAYRALHELIGLHLTIWDALFKEKILPFADVLHAVASAVSSYSSLDVNLKLFDLIGRLALRGLWLVWHLAPATGPIVVDDALIASQKPSLRGLAREQVKQIDALCQKLTQIIENNHVLMSPVSDAQAIDIGLALTLLATRPAFHVDVVAWIRELFSRSSFAFDTHGRYPTIETSYWKLVEHPVEQTDEYRQQATRGSILYPMLALWGGAMGVQDLVDQIANWIEQKLDHCTMQTWLPDEDSEENLYRDSDEHGAAFTDIPITAGTHDTLEAVRDEVALNGHYDALSVIKLGYWPLLLTACRYHRLPVPLHVWRALLPNIAGQ